MADEEELVECLLIFSVLKAGCQLFTICGSSCNDDNILYMSRLKLAYIPAQFACNIP